MINDNRDKDRFYFRKKTTSIKIFLKLFNNIFDQKYVKIIKIFLKRKSIFIVLIVLYLIIKFVNHFSTITSVISKKVLYRKNVKRDILRDVKKNLLS